MAGRVQRSSGAGPSSNAVEERWVGSYKRLESIGKGSFAVVYKAVHPDNNSLLAIKSIQHTLLKGKLKINLLSEIEILRKAHHPHIVGLLEVLETPHNIHLIMEFCQLGDLATFIKKRDKLGVHPITADMIRNYPNPLGGGFNEVVVRHFAKQLASALVYLTDHKLIHRDLKPQNLLLTAPIAWLPKELPENRPYQIRENPLIPSVGIASMPCLKIADFGFARHLPQTTLAETLCGSPLYMAPEILRYERYDDKVDLWSVGVVLYELAVGRPPFKASNHVELLRKIEVNMDKIPFPPDIDISNDMKLVVRGLLKKQPTERISWTNFFASGLISKPIPGLVPSDNVDLVAHEASERSSRREVVRETVREDSRNVVREHAREALSEDNRNPGRRISQASQGVSETKAVANNANDDLAMRRQHSSSSNQATRGTPPSPASLQRNPTSTTAYQTRPVLTSHATAPAVQVTRPSPTGNPEIQRRRSQYSGTTELYPIRDVPERSEREEQVQRKQNRDAREAREKAAQDVAFERDYVMVEKRAVEVNALADEMAAGPQNRGSYSKRALPRASEASPLLRRVTTQASPPAATNIGIQSSSSAPVSSPSSNQVALRSEASHPRQHSYERRYGPGKGISATSALAAALNLVNIRIHGIPNLAAFGNVSPPQHLPFPAFPTFPVTANAFALLNDSKPKMDKDQEVLERAREGATRSDVVFCYAEIKYMQLIPIAPSAPSAEGTPPRSSGERTEATGSGDTEPSSTNATASSSRNNLPSNIATNDADSTSNRGRVNGEEPGEPDEVTLTPNAIVTIAEEGMLLYSKTLQILDNVMDLCGAWYRINSRGRVATEIVEGDPTIPLSESDDLRYINTKYAHDIVSEFSKSQEELQYAGSTALVRTDSEIARINRDNITTREDAATDDVTAEAAAEEERKANAEHARTLKGIKAVMKWARERFNQTLLRVEYCERKYLAARKYVPSPHLAHPSHDNDVAAPAGVDYLSSIGNTAEDLLYWRAHEICMSNCLREVPFAVPLPVLQECLVTYKTAAYMWEAILECDGATWKEVKDESEKKKEAIKNTPPGEEVVVTWKYYNDPEILKPHDADRVIDCLHSTHMRVQYLKRKLEMREEEERRRNTGGTLRA